jgi:hypothetical protein
MRTSDKKRMALAVKEMLRMLFPYYSESFYEDKAKGIAEVIWRLGYRSKLR